MVKRKLIILSFAITLILSLPVFSNPNLDQWLDSSKTYKDLINEGFELKVTP